MRNFGFSLDKIAIVKDCILPSKGKVDKYDLLEYYVLKTLHTTTDPYVVVVADGNADIGTLPAVVAVMKSYGHRDVFLVSITSILEEMKLDVPEKHGLLTLTEEPLSILSELYLKDSSEINIKKSGGKIKEMESISRPAGLIAREIQKQFKEKGEYGELISTYEEGKIKGLKVRKRKRF